MKVLFLIVSFLPLALALRAQQLPHRHHTTHDGLAQMQVVTQFEDSRGYLWVGTKSGASWYDGEDFRTIGVADGLSAHRVNTITEDAEGAIWLGTEGGLTRFDGARSDTFLTGYWIKNVCRQGASNKLYALVTLPSRERPAWLFRREDNGKWKSLPLPYLVGTRRFPSQMMALQDGQLLLGFDSIGIYSWDGANNLQPWFVQTEPRLQSFELLKQYDGLWLRCGATAGTSYKYHYYEVLPGRKPILTATFAWQLKRPQPPSVHRAPMHNLVLVNPSSSPAYRLRQGASRPELIFEQSGIAFYTLTVSRDGIIWLGSEQGLFQLFDRSWKVFPLDKLPYIWQISEDRKGNVWFGSFTNNSYYYYNGKEISTPRAAQGLQTQVVGFGSVRDRNGIVYFPNKPLLQYDGKVFSNVDALAAFSLFYDDDRDLLLVSGLDSTKLRIRDGHGEWTFFKNEFLGSVRSVAAIAKDAAGDYWFGTVKGVARLNWASGQFKTYTAQNHRLPMLGARALFQDDRHTLWIGGTEGLLRYDAAGDSFVRVAEDAIRSMVMSIAQMDANQLFIACNDGVYVLDLRAFYTHGTHRLQILNQNNGYLGIEPGQNSFFKDRMGNLWLASSTDVVRFDADNWLRTAPIRAVFEKFEGHALPFNLSADTILNLPVGKDRFEITCAAIGANRPFQTEYSWRLDDVDTSWTVWEPYRLISYSNLPPGTHTLRLRVRTGSAVADIPVNTIRIKVTIPLWQRPAYILSMVLLLIIALFMLGWLVRRSGQRLHEEKKHAEHLRLETDYRKIQILSAQMNPHFMYNVLTSVQDLVKRGDKNKAEKHLIQFSQMLRQFLTSAVHENDSFSERQVTDNEISLKDELSLIDNYVDFEQLTYPDRFEYHPLVQLSLAQADYTIPPMIVQPFIENAVKNGLLNKKNGLGNLWFRVHDERDCLVFTVEDDGIGRAAAAKLRQESPEAHRPLGGNLVEKRCQLLNKLGYDITITTTDRLNGGTIVTIKIGYSE